ncbi:MAG TPA: ATP-binding cassette domain-containing protein, partial [Spirochaetota bacterium]|nr:ATP-binding cassette domain-containing protein [Spirochaetota bacterium]
MKLSVSIRKKLPGFDLDVEFETNGSGTGILGASGSGKSMTLRCVAGIEKPDSGLIVLGDRVLFDSEKGINLPSRQRGIGMVFQNYALFPHMTAADNISFGLDSCTKTERKRR